MSTRRPNTAEHDATISATCKMLVPRVLNLCDLALKQAATTNGITNNDPLRAEKYIYLVDRLSEAADRLYKLGESAKRTALEAAQNPTHKDLKGAING